MMSPVISIIIAVLVIIIALRMLMKFTGCLVKIIIVGVAIWIVLMVLNISFNFLSSLFHIFF